MQKRLLIIDDAHANTALIEAVLLKENYEITTSNDGQKGLEDYLKSIDKKRFDLIILDILMPKISGIEILKKIREEEASRGIKYGHGASVPVIMLTASKEEWLDAFDIGCNDYIIKPFEKKSLIDKVSRLCN